MAGDTRLYRAGMSSRVRIGLWTAGLVLCSCALLWREGTLRGNGGLTVHFLDVGQGDSALLVGPSGQQILIDGGPDLSTLQHLGRLMPFFDRRIELLILTHPDLDHVASFPEVLQRYRIETLLLTGVAHHSAHYHRLLFEAKAQGTRLLQADPDTDIDFGDGLHFDLLWPPPILWGEYAKEVNDTSIVLKAIYGDTIILFTGDIGEKAEKQMLQEGIDIDSDILKVPHHGSKTSSGTGFLLAVSPELAVISAGRENRYGHPHPSVVARLRSLGIPVRTTAQEGTVTMRFER